MSSSETPILLLADRFAGLLKRAMEECCVAFERRADNLLVRLESTR